MKHRYISLLASLGMALLPLSMAHSQIRIGVITSDTGPMSLIGIPQGQSIALLPQEVAGQTVQYLRLDDRSDPSISVSNFKKLTSEERVDAVIGPSGTPNAMALVLFAAEAGTPLLTLSGGASVVLPMNDQKRWVFKPSQNDGLIAEALVDDMARRGIKTLALFGTADSFGDSWAQEIRGLTRTAGIEVVADERFNRGDVSVTGQSLRVLRTKPEAVLVLAPGAAAVLPQSTLRGHGYQGTVYQTHGAAMEGFLSLGRGDVEGTILAASPLLVIGDIPESHPSRRKALEYQTGYQQRYGSIPATFGAAAYDAGLLLQNAIPAALAVAAPGTPEFRAALRDALERTAEFAGTQGVYNMTPEDHSGLDARARVMVTVKDGGWALHE